MSMTIGWTNTAGQFVCMECAATLPEEEVDYAIDNEDVGPHDDIVCCECAEVIQEAACFSLE